MSAAVVVGFTPSGALEYAWEMVKLGRRASVLKNV